MLRHGVPIPPGFVLTTDAYRHYQEQRAISDPLAEQIRLAMSWLGAQIGRYFGDRADPLLVSVRSSPPRSMPGMLDTILNVGLTRSTTPGFASMSTPELAWDCRRRLLEQYALVLGGDSVLRRALQEMNAPLHALPARAIDALPSPDQSVAACQRIEQITLERLGRQMPDEAWGQLAGAIGAVFDAWMGPRARRYRRHHAIDDALGTAVIVEAMVFGNRDGDSGSGVIFSRSPITGETPIYGEWLPHAQGEEVVAGQCDPIPINTESRFPASVSAPPFAHSHPTLYHELCGVAARLEQLFREMQEIEFTLERGRIWILQSREGKRSRLARERIAIDLSVTGDTSLSEPSPYLRQRDHDLELTTRRLVAHGLPVAPGIGRGRIVIDPEQAERLGEQEPIVLVSEQCAPEWVGGVLASRALLTRFGGLTSHLGVICIDRKIPCLSGCHGLVIERNGIRLGEQRFEAGELLEVNGYSGEIFCDGP